MAEQRELSGILYKNDRKEKDNHPDLTGSIMIKGVAYWLSAWKKDTGKGPFYSIAAKPKDQDGAKPENDDLI